MCFYKSGKEVRKNKKAKISLLSTYEMKNMKKADI